MHPEPLFGAGEPSCTFICLRRHGGVCLLLFRVHFCHHFSWLWASSHAMVQMPALHRPVPMTGHSGCLQPIPRAGLAGACVRSQAQERPPRHGARAEAVPGRHTRLASPRGLIAQMFECQPFVTGDNVFPVYHLVSICGYDAILLESLRKQIFICY